MQRIVASSTALVLVAACATVKSDQRIYSAKKVAIVSFHGPRNIGGGAAGLVAAAQSGNDWGAKLADGIYDDVQGRIGRALKAELLPSEQVVAAPGYANLKQEPGERHAPKGMKAVSTDKQYDVSLGNLAKELNVDAVIVVKNTWSIGTDSTDRQIGTNLMEVVVVAPDGTRLWEQSEYVQGPAAEVSLGQIGAEMLGAMSEEKATDMARTATLQSVDKFCYALTAKK